MSGPEYFPGREIFCKKDLGKKSKKNLEKISQWKIY